MKTFPRIAVCHPGAFYAGLVVLLIVSRADAQPTIISTVPANLATGVSVNASVVFTFSEAMNPSQTGATFFDTSPFQIIPTGQVWSGGNTVLTCTPGSPWPLDHSIVWSMAGRNPGGTALAGTTSGTFTTGTPASTTSLVLTNYGSISGNGFGFDVTCDIGQSLVAEYRSNLAVGSWQILATTNTTTSLVHFAHPNAMTNQSCFYRVRTGP